MGSLEFKSGPLLLHTSTMNNRQGVCRPNTDLFRLFQFPLHQPGTTIAITTALVVACALGLMFSSTRWMGIAAAAILTSIYPLPSVVILILGFAIFYAFKH
jgi:ABC-type proline/glycine betaine transport system permease subunit